MSNSLRPPWTSLGQNTVVGNLSLLQGIFPIQGSNPGFLHCRQILYQLSHKGSPRILEWVAYPFSSRSAWPRNQTRVSCIAGRFFTNGAIREDWPILKYHLCQKRGWTKGYWWGSWSQHGAAPATGNRTCPDGRAARRAVWSYTVYCGGSSQPFCFKYKMCFLSWCCWALALYQPVSGAGVLRWLPPTPQLTK